jgi:hypothetical protein
VAERAVSEAPDLIELCRPGAILRTRDRSEATIIRVEAETGLIYGEVRMFGACVWRRDGLYRDAPGGAAGPLDLMPPDAGSEPPRRKTISLRAALESPGRAFCCD